MKEAHQENQTSREVFRNYRWKREKGEENWTKKYEIEMAIKNLEDNTDNCSQTSKKPRVLER